MSEEKKGKEVIDEVVEEQTDETLDSNMLTKDTGQGIKELSNEERIEELQNVKFNGNDVGPKLHHDDNERVKVEMKIYYSKKDGKILAVNLEGTRDPNVVLEQLDIVGIVKLYFVFTVPDYERYNVYRRLSSRYVREAGSQIVDRLRLRSYLIMYHLVETNYPLIDGDGKDVELGWEEEDGKEDDVLSDDYRMLSDKSLEAIYRIQPVILEFVLFNYEQMAMVNTV